MKLITIFGSVMMAGVLAGCGGGSVGGPGTGTLDLQITDSPVDDADEVVVVFTGVDIKPAGGEAIAFDYCDPAVDVGQCRQIDLLALQGGATADLLDDEVLAAGNYEWVRLRVYTDPSANDASYILITTDSGTEKFNLIVPSGNQTGLKLVSGFSVAQGGLTRLGIDFDLRKSVIAPPGRQPNYVLKPTLRLFNLQDTATINGAVDLAVLEAEQGVTPCVGGVYLFSGAGVAPDDQDGDAADGIDPVFYGGLEVDPVQGGTVAEYLIPFVDAGDSGSAPYTVAFTCNFDVDELPDASEYDANAADGEPGFATMAWTVSDVTVSAGESSEVNLP